MIIFGSTNYAVPDRKLAKKKASKNGLVLVEYWFRRSASPSAVARLQTTRERPAYFFS